MNLKKSTYSSLKATIGQILEEGRGKAAHAVNTILVETYWQIGRHIVEYEQGGEERAAYGKELLAKLSKDLTLEYGKGFSRSNLTYMRKFYLAFPKSETLSHKLSWSHYFEILKTDDPLELNFYLRQCEQEKWSVRELKRQMKSMLFHRIALSRNKKGVMDIANEGAKVQTPSDILRDPYVFEFLGLPEQKHLTESELEKKLIDHLESFLLEMGKGFAFVGRQYRISISGRHFYVDLVFYHRILKCFVLIDLKTGEVEHNDVGQMNLYLNYFEKEESVEDDNQPIGIVLGAHKDHILIEYATANISNQLFVSKYQLYLPDQKQLAAALGKHLNDE